MSKIQFQAYTLVVLMALSVVGVRAGRRTMQAAPPKTQFEMIPMDLDVWTGIQDEFGEDTAKYLPSASLLLRHYMHEDYPTTSLAIVYGTDLGDFHQPEVCLQGQGHKIISKSIVTVHPKQGEPFEAVSLNTEGPSGPTVFLYWFSSNNQTSPSLGNYQGKIFIDRLMGQEIKPSAMIRLSTAVDSSVDESIKQLAVFAGDFAPYLQKQFATAEDTK